MPFYDLNVKVRADEKQWHWLGPLKLKNEAVLFLHWCLFDWQVEYEPVFHSGWCHYSQHDHGERRCSLQCHPCWDECELWPENTPHSEPWGAYTFYYFVFIIMIMMMIIIIIIMPNCKGHYLNRSWGMPFFVWYFSSLVVRPTSLTFISMSNC